MNKKPIFTDTDLQVIDLWLSGTKNHIKRGNNICIEGHILIHKGGCILGEADQMETRGWIKIHTGMKSATYRAKAEELARIVEANQWSKYGPLYSRDNHPTRGMQRYTKQ